MWRIRLDSGRYILPIVRNATKLICLRAVSSNPVSTVQQTQADSLSAFPELYSRIVLFKFIWRFHLSEVIWKIDMN